MAVRLAGHEVALATASSPSTARPTWATTPSKRSCRGRRRSDAINEPRRHVAQGDDGREEEAPGDPHRVRPRPRGRRRWCGGSRTVLLGTGTPPPAPGQSPSRTTAARRSDPRVPHGTRLRMKLLVFLEHHEHAISPGSLGVLTHAAGLDPDVGAVLVGDDQLALLADEAGSHGAATVFTVVDAFPSPLPGPASTSWPSWCAATVSTPSCSPTPCSRRTSPPGSRRDSTPASTGTSSTSRSATASRSGSSRCSRTRYWPMSGGALRDGWPCSGRAHSTSRRRRARGAHGRVPGRGLRRAHDGGADHGTNAARRRRPVARRRRRHRRRRHRAGF